MLTNEKKIQKCGKHYYNINNNNNYNNSNHNNALEKSKYPLKK